MSEDADIEVLPLEEEPIKPKGQAGPKIVGLKTLGVGVILASILGASGGLALTKGLQSPTEDMSPLTAKIDALQSENKTLKAQVNRLRADIKALPKPATLDVTKLTSRIDVLESAKPQEIDLDLVARLEALKEGGSEALDLSEIIARLEALESRPAVAASVKSDSAPLAVSSLNPFPQAAVLAAIESTQPSGGWLKRSLKKHISVQSEDNPAYLVELIVQSLEDKNIKAAVTAFDKLPDEAKLAAKAWRESVESN